MTTKLRLYVATIISLGIIYFIYTINMSNVFDIKGVIIFVVLSIIAESLLIPTSGEIGVSVGFAIGLAAILVVGVPEAAWVTSAGIMLRVLKNKDQKILHIFNVPFYKTLFNGANLLISTGISGYCYRLLGGVSGVIDLNTLGFPLILGILIYVLIHESIISTLMSIITGDGFVGTWLNNVLWLVKDCIFLAPLGVLMAIAYVKYSIAGVVLFMGPLLLARYSYKLYIDMRRIYIETVGSLSQAIEAKDPYTKGHSMRVSDYAAQLAHRMKISKSEIENLKMAAILHDIGKIGIEENILNKPGKLTPDEYDKIKQHPEIGVKIIQDIEFLRKASDIIIGHHEKYDGTGYPYGKARNEIRIESAILCVADVFDALTSSRPYREAMTVDQALTIIEAEKGKRFNRQVADQFIKMIKEQKELKVNDN